MQEVSPFIKHHGMTVPSFVYGTAWKEDKTKALTHMALKAGFRGIDTANQRKHYHEVGVGEALKEVFESGLVKRKDLFLQTKFTYQAGQDHRLPYDPKADYTTQVNQSFSSSLEHLRTDYLDSYVLHGPSHHHGLSESDWEVWSAMEELKKSGKTKLLGVSNINAEQLQLLLEKAIVKPAFVQNRTYARTKWDAQVRHICKEHDIRYQGFSLLSANARELNQKSIHQIAQRLDCEWTQVVFLFALQMGMQPLTGTTSQSHMEQDLSVFDMDNLTNEEIQIIENIAL